MPAVGGGNQLRRDPDPIACPPHAPFQDVRHVQRLGNPADILLLAAKRERGRSRDHLQPTDTREQVDDLFRADVAASIVWSAQ
jgi:hypothetical protein